MLMEQIKADIKTAMINKDELVKNTLRMVMGNAQLAAKEDKKEVSDQYVVNAITKEIKQTNQAIDILKTNGQTSGKFYEDNLKKVELLQKYLPKQLSEEEIEAKVRELVADIDKTNKGLVMKTVMAELKGKADGKLINQITMKVING